MNLFLIYFSILTSVTFSSLCVSAWLSLARSLSLLLSSLPSLLSQLQGFSGLAFALTPNQSVLSRTHKLFISSTLTPMWVSSSSLLRLSCCLFDILRAYCLSAGPDPTPEPRSVAPRVSSLPLGEPLLCVHRSWLPCIIWAWELSSRAMFNLCCGMSAQLDTLDCLETCHAQPLNVVAAVCAVFAWLALSDVCSHPTSPRDGCRQWISCLLTWMASTFTVMRFAVTPCRVLVNRRNKHGTDSLFAIFIIFSLSFSFPFALALAHTLTEQQVKLF